MNKKEFRQALIKELNDWVADNEYISQDDELSQTDLFKDFIAFIDDAFDCLDPAEQARRRQLVRDLINQARADEASRQTGG